MKTGIVDQYATTEFNLTIIDNRHLLERLVVEMVFLERQISRAWVDLRKDPIAFGSQTTRACIDHLKRLILAPNMLPAISTALLIITSIVGLVFIFDRGLKPTEAASDLANKNEAVDMVILELTKPSDSSHETSVGRDGTGRVGFNREKGEGSGAEPKHSQGGGTGGQRDPLPPQRGELPPPSTILAAIPNVPPLTTPTLPAGIDIDPALYKDLKSPVYGDPRSASEAPSKGPGDGGGIGINDGLGVGDGTRGAGFGPGSDGNMGGNQRQIGCCGPGGARENSTGNNRIFRVTEVEQRARLLSKPEPQYTEEARQNQVMGTVMLRVVFSSLGEVTQIRAVQSLPFGLTERAIAAARQIRFLPATKGGHPVSVYMQLEYNFNLY